MCETGMVKPSYKVFMYNDKIKKWKNKQLFDVFLNHICAWICLTTTHVKVSHVKSWESNPTNIQIDAIRWQNTELKLRKKFDSWSLSHFDQEQEIGKSLAHFKTQHQSLKKGYKMKNKKKHSAPDRSSIRINSTLLLS